MGDPRRPPGNHPHPRTLHDDRDDHGPDHAEHRRTAAAQPPAQDRSPSSSSSRPLVLLVAALGYPIGWQVVTSFQQYGLMQQFGAAAPFVGLDNYIALVTDPYLWTVVVRSIVFCVVTAVVTVAIGGAMAVLMNALVTWPASCSRSPCSSPGRCPSSRR